VTQGVAFGLEEHPFGTQGAALRALKSVPAGLEVF